MRWAMVGFRRHRHEWGPWRVTLMTLTDSPFLEPTREARHCDTCPKMEMRLRPPAAEGGHDNE
jgi:hypothetical protein